jgi:hypothetical protein
MAWVRGNIGLFVVENVDSGAKPSASPKATGAGVEASSEGDVASIPSGGKFNALGRSWSKVDRKSLGQLTDGDWLAVGPAGNLLVANAYLKAGMSEPRIRSDGAWLSPEVAGKYSFVAKPET